MFTKAFWKAAFERAVKSAAQGVLGLWLMEQFNALSADWVLAGGVAAGAVVLSILTSLVSAPFGPTAGSPSLVKEPTTATPVKAPSTR